MTDFSAQLPIQHSVSRFVCLLAVMLSRTLVETQPTSVFEISVRNCRPRQPRNLDMTCLSQRQSIADISSCEQLTPLSQSCGRYGSLELPGVTDVVPSSNVCDGDPYSCLVAFSSAA
jgi:hypothetical protein